MRLRSSGRGSDGSHYSVHVEFPNPVRHDEFTGAGEILRMEQRAQAFEMKCEPDYAALCDWFGVAVGAGLGPSNRVIVTLTKSVRGGFNFGYSRHNPQMSVNPYPETPSDEPALGYFVAEMIEILMSYKGSWVASNSGGEGLSRVAAQLLHPQYGNGFINAWLSSDPTTDPTSAVDDSEFRKDWISKNFTGGPLRAGGAVGGDDDSYSYGCAMLFIYYLKSQLGYSMRQIVQNGGATLADTYRNLTGGRTNAFSAFKSFIDSHYPPGRTYHPSSDNIFPASELAAISPPNTITCGYSAFTDIILDRPAMAEVFISLSSDNSLVIVDPSVTILGSISKGVTVWTQPIPCKQPFPPKHIDVHAMYAGKTVTTTVAVVPPRLTGITLSPNTVICGETSTATVTLERSSLASDVDVDVVCSSGFATVPNQVSVLQNQLSKSFDVTTPDFPGAFNTAHPVIHATYDGISFSATLTVKPKVIIGILRSLTLFPSTVKGGVASNGIVTLEETVPTDTLVALAAVDPLSEFPDPSNASSDVSAPDSVTILAGQISADFVITTNHLPPHSKRLAAIIAAAGVVTKSAMLTVAS